VPRVGLLLGAGTLRSAGQRVSRIFGTSLLGAPLALVLIWGVTLAVHATLLGTSAIEAGHVRHTVASHVLDLMLLLWLTAELWTRRRNFPA
jgi:hypothetical protein